MIHRRGDGPLLDDGVHTFRHAAQFAHEDAFQTSLTVGEAKQGHGRPLDQRLADVVHEQPAEIRIVA